MFQLSRVRLGSAIVALALLVTSCGGGDSESSNRQRNSALTPCVTATVGEGLEIGTSGANVEVTIGVCSGVTAIQFIDESTNNVSAPSPAGEGSTTPLNIEVPALTEASPTVQRKVTVRVFGLDQVIAEDVVTLTVNETGAVSVAVTPGDVTGSDTSAENSSALVPVTNLALTFTSSDGTRDDYVLSFEYPATELERVDGFLMETGLASSATKDRNTMINKKFLSATDGGGLTFKFQQPVGLFLAGMTYDLQLTPYVLDNNNPDLPKPEISAAVSTTFIAASGEPTANGNSNPDPNTTNATSNSQSPTEPQTPTDLKMSEGDTRVLTWTPSRTSETGYVYDATKYPYRYRVNWRRTDSPNDPYTTVISISNVLQLNPYEYLEDAEYEFAVEEVFQASETEPLVASTPSSPIVTVPFTATFFRRLEAERAAALEKSRLAAIECMKVAPQAELLLQDPSSRTVEATAPVNSDDDVMLAIMHPCETNVESGIGFNLREIDPVSKRVVYDNTLWGQGNEVVFTVDRGRLAPGAHLFVIQTRWDGGDPFGDDNVARDKVPSTEWSIQVAQGTQPFPRRCFPENASIEGRKLTFNCESRLDITWRGDSDLRRYVKIDDEKNQVILPEFSDGWHFFSLRISQRNYRRQSFDYSVCLRNCENSKLSPEFTVSPQGDTLNISFKQNECGGDPKALVTEYIKISDNLFYEFNSSYRVSQTVVSENEPVSLTLSPLSEAIRGVRTDSCGRRDQEISSFMKISRPKAEPLTSETVTNPTQTNVEIRPEDLVTTSQQNISVPATTETLTIPGEVVSALASAGGTVTVVVGSNEPKVLLEETDLSLALPPTAKSITFNVTDSNGRVTQVTKPIVRQPETEIVRVVEDAGQTVPKVKATPASEVSDTSGLSPLTLVLIALVVLALALIAFQFVRRKA